MIAFCYYNSIIGRGQLVLDPGGRWLGRVEVPEDFRVMEIGMDEVLGVWHDELDVQHPRVLHLRRDGG